VHVPFVHVAPFWHTLPHAPQLFASVAVDVHAPLQTVWLLVQLQTPARQTGVSPEHLFPHAPQLLGSVCSVTQAPPHPDIPLEQQMPLESVVPDGQAQIPAAQICFGKQALPHAPQFWVSVARSMQKAPPQVVTHAQAPSMHAFPGSGHSVSFSDTLSMTPSQSLSMPSHDSWVAVHWQTFPDWPSSAAHDQPLTQSVSAWHVVEHTAPEATLPLSAAKLDTGWQIPLRQSEFLAHGAPVPFAGATSQVPLRQLRVAPQVLPPQQAWPLAPQGGARSTGASGPIALPSGASVGPSVLP
jgi:hypothetical protein